jgi:hypothetical protein
LIRTAADLGIGGSLLTIWIVDMCALTLSNSVRGGTNRACMVTC